MTFCFPYVSDVEYYLSLDESFDGKRCKLRSEQAACGRHRLGFRKFLRSV